MVRSIVFTQGPACDALCCFACTESEVYDGWPVSISREVGEESRFVVQIGRAKLKLSNNSLCRLLALSDNVVIGFSSVSIPPGMVCVEIAHDDTVGKRGELAKQMIYSFAPAHGTVQVVYSGCWRS